MEPVTIAIICAVAFGGVVAVSAFVRQLMLSRDKRLNDQAQQKALQHEIDELEKMRQQLESSKRFDAHYKILGSNKDAIVYLDTKIDDLLKKKAQLIERYGQLTTKESSSILDGDVSAERKKACDRLRLEIDSEINFYNSELEYLKKGCGVLWDSHQDLEIYLLNQEEQRNKTLDSIYEKHTAVLEKIYIRHTDQTEHVARDSIKAGTESFKSMVMAPIQFLMQYFGLSTGISLDQVAKEIQKRTDVSDAQDDINGGNYDSDYDPDSDDELEDGEKLGFTNRKKQLAWT